MCFALLIFVGASVPPSSVSALFGSSAHPASLGGRGAAPKGAAGAGLDGHLSDDDRSLFGVLGNAVSSPSFLGSSFASCRSV